MTEITYVERFVSWQGEGIGIGDLAVFLRLAGCNIGDKCPFECDTKYAWHPRYAHLWKKKEAKVLAKDIYKIMKGFRSTPDLVITGGEPLLQQDGLTEMLSHLSERMWEAGLKEPYVIVETNGTLAPTQKLASFVDYFVVSPKSKDLIDEFWLSDASPFYVFKLFKVVVWRPDQVFEWVEFFESEGIDFEQVVFMPMGRTREEILQSWENVKGAILELGLNISPRVQIMLGFD